DTETIPLSACQSSAEISPLSMPLDRHDSGFVTTRKAARPKALPWSGNAAALEIWRVSRYKAGSSDTRQDSRVAHECTRSRLSTRFPAKDSSASPTITK